MRFRYNMESKGTTISPELGERIRGFLADYNAENQFRMDADETNMLLDRYDLTEWLAGQRLITGSIDEVLHDLRKLYDAGATNIVMPQMLADVVATTKALAPVVEGTGTW